ncbi:MAG: peptidase M3, partial [Candidatus Krumholzibacteria bacterium]|nr:peptidase M3 [Candidatus Krumholzibacteria bacterium]
MRKTIFLVVAVSLLVCSFSLQEQNPFFSDFDTPFGVPPFDRIRVEHYMPAFMEGMKQQQEEIDDIVNSTGPPTFENSIEALESGGALLIKVGNVFRNMNSANTNEDIQSIAKEI